MHVGRRRNHGPYIIIAGLHNEDTITIGGKHQRIEPVLVIQRTAIEGQSRILIPRDGEIRTCRIPAEVVVGIECEVGIKNAVAAVVAGHSIFGCLRDGNGGAGKSRNHNQQRKQGLSKGKREMQFHNVTRSLYVIREEE